MSSLVDLFKEKENKNFKYLLDIDDEKYSSLFTSLYNDIITCISKFKLRYKAFATDLRGVYNSILDLTSEIFWDDHETNDNVQDKLNFLFANSNTSLENNPLLCKFLLTILSINAEKTIEKIKSGDNRPFFNNFNEAKKLRDYKTIKWKENEISIYFSGIRIDNNKIVDFDESDVDDKNYKVISLIYNFNYAYSSFIIKNFNQGFLNYIIHSQERKNEVVFKNDEAQILFNDVKNNPHKYFLHSIKFINKYLISLINVKYGKNLNEEDYAIDTDLFKIGDLEVINSIEIEQTNKKIMLARTGANSDFRYYILQEYEFDSNITKNDKLSYNTIEISNALTGRRSDNVISIEEIKNDNNEVIKYKIYSIKLGVFDINNNDVLTLHSSDLVKLSSKKKYEAVEDLYNILDVFHNKDLYLRYMDLDTFVLINIENVELQIISIEFVKMDRKEEYRTVRDYIPSNVILDNLFDGVDFSNNEVSLIVDTIYAANLATYIMSCFEEKKFDRWDFNDRRKIIEEEFKENSELINKINDLKNKYDMLSRYLYGKKKGKNESGIENIKDFIKDFNNSVLTTLKMVA